ncbi:unnamed protein product [Auanema sp. JU1783]|nr:unnamed protein product [Auanema sp. JU1783]
MSTVYITSVIVFFYRSSIFLLVVGATSPSFCVKTAREKHRSVTAEDAAQAVVDVEKAMRYQQSSKQSVAAKAVPSSAPRGSKTLGWFLDNDIFEKKGAQVKNEKIVSKSADNLKKKKRGLKKPNKKSSETGSDGSATSEDGTDELKKQALLSDTYGSKDDYIVYDIASDGYYYEQGSARGWRRRQTNSVGAPKPKDQDVESKLLKTKAASQNQLQAAATRAFLQAAAMNPGPLKYYDPSSDGYFYEMASVDGWKKRVPPQGPRVHPGSTSNNTATTSYGAALAKGQMPKNCIIDDSSASSSVSEDFSAQDFFGNDSCFRSFRLPRPSSLTLETNNQILPSFNADQFIQDLSFSGIDQSKLFGSGTPTPRGAPLWEDTDKLDSEDVVLGNLLKGLEDIWTNPT